jgi:hypothetical protein
MAAARPPSLSIAVANAGGRGARGAVMVTPDGIGVWAIEFRAGKPRGLSNQSLDSCSAGSGKAAPPDFATLRDADRM